MGKTDLPSFTQFYPTGFTHWVKLPCQPCLQSSSSSSVYFAQSNAINQSTNESINKSTNKSVTVGQLVYLMFVFHE